MVLILDGLLTLKYHSVPNILLTGDGLGARDTICGIDHTADPLPLRDRVVLRASLRI